MPSNQTPLHLNCAQWKGCVTEINDNTFHGLVRNSVNEELMEIPISEVSEEDRELLVIGALFELVVVTNSGDSPIRKLSFSKIKWTQSSLDSAKHKAQMLSEHFENKTPFIPSESKTRSMSVAEKFQAKSHKPSYPQNTAFQKQSKVVNHTRAVKRYT